MLIWERKIKITRSVTKSAKKEKSSEYGIDVGPNAEYKKRFDFKPKFNDNSKIIMKIMTVFSSEYKNPIHQIQQAKR